MAFARQMMISLLMVPFMAWRPVCAVDPNVSSTETSTGTSTTSPATVTGTSSATSTSASSTSAHTATRTFTTGTPTSTMTATSTNTATSSITQTRGFDCLGNPSMFDAGWGDCYTYSPGTENYYYCDEDFDLNINLFALQVCPRCGFCVYNGITSDAVNSALYNETFECLGDASTFDAGYGNCSSYAEELDYTWDYCGGDYDNQTGLFAFQVCSECQRCYPPPPDTETNTSTTSVQAAMDTATTVFTATTTISIVSSIADSTAAAQPTEPEDEASSAARQGSGVTMGLLLLLLCAALAQL